MMYRKYINIPTFQCRGERYRCTVIFCRGWRWFWAPQYFDEGRVYRLRLGPVMFKAMVDDPQREIPVLDGLLWLNLKYACWKTNESPHRR